MKYAVWPLIALALTACDLHPDTDLDGLTDKEEAILGTDPESPDSDGDGVGDLDEVYQYSTDPLVADTDQDGFDDGVEVDFGSDPLDWMGHPWGEGVEQWVDNAHRVDSSVAEVGFGMGQQLPDLDFVDQYGQPVSLHQFWGKVVLVDVSTGWCGPSRSVAAESEAIYQELDGQDFVIIHWMIDDNTNDREPVESDWLAAYAEEYGLTHPTVAVEGKAWETFTPWADQPYYKGGIPFLVLLDQHLIAVDSATGGGGEVAMAERAAELLGIEGD